MDFEEYKEKIINKTNYSENLKFSYYVWINNNKYMPAILQDIDNNFDTILKIPKYIKNSYGNMVKVVNFKGEIFGKNKNLTDIIFPNSITKFDSNSFVGCEKLERITIPKTIKEIKKDAFKDCISLKEVYYEGSIEDWKKINIYDGEYILDNKNLGICVNVIKIKNTGNNSLLNAKIYYNCKFFDENEKEIYKTEFGYSLEELLKKSQSKRLTIIKDKMSTRTLYDLFDIDVINKLINGKIIKQYCGEKYYTIINKSKFKELLK